jgi:tetratricopeptide (TPR) repeat protein
MPGGCASAKEGVAGLPRVFNGVTRLIANGFVRPTRGPRNEYRFSFRDVVLLRTAHQLQAADIPTRKIVRALQQLKSRLPSELPLSGLRITAVGSKVAVRERGSQWEAESGQLLMDFEVAAQAGSVAFVAHQRGPELCESRRDAEAVALYDEALARRPSVALLHFNRAVALEDLGRLAQAIQGYERCLNLDPALGDAQFNAARLHDHLGHKQQAIRHFSAYRRLQRP